MFEFASFDLNKPHTFTIDGKPTRLGAGDIIVLQELDDPEVPTPKFKFVSWRPWKKDKKNRIVILFFVRNGFTLRIDSAAAIRFEAGKYKFHWLVEFLAAVSGLNLELHKMDNPKAIAFKFV